MGARVLSIAAKSPADTLASAAATAAVLAILINGLFLQKGHHPAPLFRPAMFARQPQPAAVLPQPFPRERPPGADTRTPPRVAPMPSVAPAAVHRDPVGYLIAEQRRITAIQRALTEFGYGQIKPDGLLGPETRTAIEKFEREQKLPITGDISDRLVRDLATMTGRPIE